MLSELGNELKKVVMAGIGALAVTAEKSEELVKDLVKKGELTVEQGKTINEELKHKIKETVQEHKTTGGNTNVSKATVSVDVASMSPEERDALKKKLEELETKDRNGTEENTGA